MRSRPGIIELRIVRCERNEYDRNSNQRQARPLFNASTNQYEDLLKSGVIDQTKVTRTALQNAASIASLMLRIEAMICGIVEEADNQALARWPNKGHA